MPYFYLLFFDSNAVSEEEQYHPVRCGVCDQVSCARRRTGFLPRKDLDVDAHTVLAAGNPNDYDVLTC